MRPPLFRLYKRLMQPVFDVPESFSNEGHRSGRAQYSVSAVAAEVASTTTQVARFTFDLDRVLDTMGCVCVCVCVVLLCQRFLSVSW